MFEIIVCVIYVSLPPEKCQQKLTVPPIILEEPYERCRRDYRKCLPREPRGKRPRRKDRR